MVLILVGRRWRIRPPALFSLYVAWYTFGRFLLEQLRIDPSGMFWGMRVNAWVSLVLFIASSLFFIYWQLYDGKLPRLSFRRGRAEPSGRRWPCRAGAAGAARRQAALARVCALPRSDLLVGRAGSSAVPRPVVVRELELDLDAFEGPFDLLLSLVLREELDLAEVDVAGIIVAFIERLAERDQLDLEACGEFLVLVAALLELKARGLFEEDADLAELEPEEAAEELARRLEEYRRMKEAAGWLTERLAAERDRFFRLGPAPLAPRTERKLAPQEPESLAAVLRVLAQEPPNVSLAHMALRFPPVSQFVERFRALLARRTRFDFDEAVDGLSRIEVAVAFLALLDLKRANEIAIEQAAPFAPIRISHPDVERTESWTVRSA